MMGLITTKATTASTEATAVGVKVTPSIITEILTLLLSLLSGCVPMAATAGDRIRNLAAGNGKRIDQLMYQRAVRRFGTGFDPEVIEAVITDQMANVSDEDVKTMFSELPK